MSITFFCPDAPTEQYAPFSDEPDYFEKRPVAPFTEVNISDSNAPALLALLDPEGGGNSYGIWDQAKLQVVLRRLMILQNTNKKDKLLLASEVTGSDGHLRTYDPGRSDEYVTRRINDFMMLVTVAIQHKFNVSFG